jgi:hypothetical protein
MFYLRVNTYGDVELSIVRYVEYGETRSAKQSFYFKVQEEIGQEAALVFEKKLL